MKNTGIEKKKYKYKLDINTFKITASFNKRTKW